MVVLNAGNVRHFETVLEAYLHYLQHYSTEDEWSYYRQCCGLNLDDLQVLQNDDLMEVISHNVFTHGIIFKNRG